MSARYDTTERFFRPADVAALRRNQRRIQIQRIILVGSRLVVVGAIVAGALWIYGRTQSDARFALKTIEVTGAVHTPRSAVNAITQAYVGANLFRLDIAHIQNDLRSLGWVSRIETEKQLPDTLRVRIVERTPVALVQSGDRLQYVDENGVPFAELSPAVGDSDLPLITGATGAELARCVALLRALRARDAEVFARISEVRPMPPDGFALFDRQLGAVVYAREGDLSAKWRDLYAIAGAEKLREQIAKGYQEKFGITILEGYGCTELSPVVAVNTPDVGDGKEKQIGHKPGTVGHPIPGVAAKVVDPDTGQVLGPGEEGLLLIKGPNVMLGYLNQENLTDQVMRRGWYVTGDIAAIDEDGFIKITDRLSRFSKIGGEMVPHMKVEEAINQILGSAVSVVTALPDPQRGEKLIAFYTQNGMTREVLWSKLNQTELPKLWIPKRENLHLIDSIPVLGSGKADLKKIKALAAERTAS